MDLTTFVSRHAWLKKTSVALLFLVIINFFLYLPSLHHDFLKDDFRLIVENPRIKDFDSFINSIDGKFFAFPDFPYLHYWRPLTLFSFYLDYQLWGLNPGGYHLVNILLNALTALLLFLLLRRLTGNHWFSFFVTLFFSLHPSHVEAVSWVSGRTDLLAAAFMFGAMLMFFQFLVKRHILYYIYTLSFFTCGLLSKENAVLFPIAAAGLIIIYNHLRKSPPPRNTGPPPVRPGPPIALKKAALFLLPPLLLDIVYVLVHNRFSGVQEALSGFSFSHIPAMFKTIGVYTQVILTPFFPSPYFSMQQYDTGAGVLYIYFLAALTILGLVIWKAKEYRFTLYSLLCFIFLLPVLDPEIVPSYPKIVIRFAYIPALFAGAFFIDTLRLIRRRGLKHIYIIVLAFIGVVWCIQSAMFQVYFKDDNNHYRRLVSDFPQDGSLLLPLALMDAGRGKPLEALELVNRALEANRKDRWLDVSELGGLLKANVLVITGKREEGKTLARGILKSTQKDEMKYFACLVLSKAHEKDQQLPRALDMLKKAETYGVTADLCFRTAVVYMKMNDHAAALPYAEKAVRLNPGNHIYLKLKQHITLTRERSVTSE